MTDFDDLAKRLDARLRMDEAERIATDNEGWYTANHFAETWNISLRAARERLTRAVSLGLMVVERRAAIRPGDGSTQRYLMYREASEASDVTAD